jgi:hypothetical protein
MPQQETRPFNPDNHVFGLRRDGAFYKLSEQVRKQGASDD